MTADQPLHEELNKITPSGGLLTHRTGGFFQNDELRSRGNVQVVIIMLHMLE